MSAKNYSGEMFAAPMSNFDVDAYGIELWSERDLLQESDLPGFFEYMKRGGAIASLVELELPVAEFAEAA